MSGGGIEVLAFLLWGAWCGFIGYCMGAFRGF